MDEVVEKDGRNKRKTGGGGALSWRNSVREMEREKEIIACLRAAI